ncbi:MAG TPA: hypothetical protein VGS28_03465 [Candidatus Saccharimonadales bacterium]|nr:hypothetical protein [Candidatus Saccharimonadales bacterium]
MAEKENKRGTRLSASRVLILLSILLLVIAGYNLERYSGSAYFALTGRPLNLDFWSSKPSFSQALPVFSGTETFGRSTLAPGDTQTITVSATSNTTISAYFEAWITSPKGKQVWKSPMINPVSFKAGKPTTTTYSYALPAGLPPGVYTGSLIINSQDTHTDYLAKENIVRFKVS